jgi:hypothetical protein
MDKATKKELVKKIEKWLIEQFNQLIESDINEVITFDHLLTEWNLNQDLKVDDQIMRSAISRARKSMLEAGFIIINKRSVGYKVSSKFEALDEMERKLARILVKLKAFNRPILNATLTAQDIESASDEIKLQFNNLMKIQDQTFKIRHELEDMAEASPTFKNNKRIKLGSDLDLELKNEDFEDRLDLDVESSQELLDRLF